jgi:hypothetical protein
MLRIVGRALMALALCCSALVLAQSSSTALVIPHQFTAGTPAKAAEVNDDFSAVAAAVNANGGNISTLQGELQALQKELTGVAQSLNGATGAIYIQSGGVPLGAMVPMWFTESPFSVGSQTTDYSVMALNSMGFFVVLTSQGTLAEPLSANYMGYDFYFSAADCGGTTYFGTVGETDSSGNFDGHYEDIGQMSLLLTQGIVFGPWQANDPNTGYYAKGGAAVTAASEYVLTSDASGATVQSCQNISPGPAAIYGAPVLPNDPNVTGVPASLSGPLTLTLH